MIRSLRAFFGFTRAWRGIAASTFSLSAAGILSVVVIGILREISFTRYPMATRTALSYASPAPGSMVKYRGFTEGFEVPQSPHLFGHSGASGGCLRLNSSRKGAALAALCRL